MICESNGGDKIDAHRVDGAKYWRRESRYNKGGREGRMEQNENIVRAAVGTGQRGSDCPGGGEIPRGSCQHLRYEVFGNQGHAKFRW